MNFLASDAKANGSERIYVRMPSMPVASLSNERRIESYFIPFALLIGGGGLNYPLLETAIELFAIAVIWRLLPDIGRFRDDGTARLLASFYGAAAIIAIAQLVPLPWPLWSKLPGHDVARDIYQALGWQGAWRSLSLTPDLTLQTLLSLSPPLAASVLALTAERAERRMLMRDVVVVAALSAIVGALQIAGGPQSPLRFFLTNSNDIATGLFVNRNHHALFLDCAIIFAAVPGVLRLDQNGRGSTSVAKWAVPATITFLALGVVATASRSGLTLLAPALMAALAFGLDWKAQRRRAIVSVAALGLSIAAAVQTPLVQSVLERFTKVGDDLRPQIWLNTLHAARDSFPLGTGLGSFVATYPRFEPLEQVMDLIINNAHNDFLELTLEVGLLGLIPATLAALVVARGLRQSWLARNGARSLRLAVPGAVVLSLIAGASITDYPTRIFNIAVLAGLCLGVMVRRVDGSQTVRSGTSRRKRSQPLRLSGLVLLIAVALSALNGAGRSLASSGEPELAAVIAPWSSNAWNLASLGALANGKSERAISGARHALAISPISAPALRVLCLMGLGDSQIANDALYTAASRLGWREPGLQATLAQRAASEGRTADAMRQADAAMRGAEPSARASLFPSVWALALSTQEGTQALAKAIGNAPNWRTPFLNWVVHQPQPETAALTSIAADLQHSVGRLSEQELALLSWPLYEAGRYAAVRDLRIASDRRELLGDASFAGLASGVPPNAAPYHWRLGSLAGTTIALGSSNSPQLKAGLGVTLNLPGRGAVLVQSLALAPGQYRLESSIAPGSGELGIDWQIVCRAGQQRSQPFVLEKQLRPDQGNVSSWQSDFIVTETCLGQELQLAIDKQNPGSDRVVLERVRIDRLPG